jgi:hypothetical protein
MLTALPPPARRTTARQDHAGKSGARDGAWNAAGELKFARMWERKFGHTAFSPVPPQALHFKNIRNRAVPLHLLHGAEINRVPHWEQESALPTPSRVGMFDIPEIQLTASNVSHGMVRASVN